MNSSEYQTLRYPPYSEHPRILFFILCISFLSGIAQGSFSGYFHIGLLIGVILPIFVSFLSQKNTILVLIASLSVFAFGTFLSIHAYKERLDDITFLREVTHGFTGKYAFTGTITKSLYQSDLRKASILRIKELTRADGEVVDLGEEQPQILFEIPKNLTIYTNDTVAALSKIQPLYSGALDGFERYTFFHDIGGKISPVSFFRENSTSPSWLNSLQETTENQLFRGFPRDVTAILLGITIGNTDLMTQYLKSKFQNAGITHILVVSGSNIAFLLIFLAGILRYIPLKRSIYTAILVSSVILYGSLVGWEPPIIRAAIMGTIAYIATLQGSKISSLSVLLLLSVIFLLFSPLSLIYDASFGLSFAATLSIILFYAPLTRFGKKIGLPILLSDLLSITLAASIGTLPVTLYHFGEISVGFFLANILIGLIMGPLLFLTTCYLLFGFLGEVFLYFFGWSIYFLSSWILLIAEKIGSLGTITLTPLWSTLGLVTGILLCIIAIFLTLDSHQGDRKVSIYR